MMGYTNLALVLTVFSGIAIAATLFMVAYFFTRKDQKQSNVLLALLFLAIGLRITKSLFYYVFDGLSAVGTAFGFLGFACIGPLLLYYFKTSKDRTFSIKWSSNWQFVFAFLGFAAIILGILSPFDWYALALVQLAVYLVYIFKSYINNFNTEVFQTWHKKLFYAVATLFTVLTYQLLAQTMLAYVVGTALSALVLYSVFIMALQSPQIIKRHKTVSKTPDGLIEKIVAAIETERIYEQPAITLAQFSEAINVPSYLISKATKEKYQKSFPEVINSYRIKAVTSKLAQPNYANEKIEDLAFDAGFNTSSAFYKAFKKETNMTPRAYQKSVIQN